MPAKKKSAAATDSAPIIAYKGFRDDLTCRPDGKVFQFEIGQTYRHDGPVKACKGGFHVITGHPLALFQYYAPAGTRICQVEISGETHSDDGGEKTAAEILTVGKEIGLTQLILDAVKWVTDRAKLVDGNHTSGDQEAVKVTDDGGAATASGVEGAATASGARGAATASGNGGAATASGDRGAATASGDRGAATASGDRGAATASGDWGAATASGYQGAATASGDWGAATASGEQGAATASGWWGAATASGYQGAATASGNGGAATASGDRGAATASGYQGAATASGYQGAATASGFEGKARGREGCALFLVERSTSGEIVNVWAGIAGRDGIKPDTWYQLRGGKPVEVE
ncbi:hypothetical protein [Mesorhizobium sp. B1-1-2]|uniref:DUF7666 domain-containing protein n=1 Tax=Mesorhizobium sp. B1-1-2 TaxID=2589982 RepID=UPI001126D9CA|nr:hypothetical protein [Mesorhizobium sp. B1-1-2]TPN79998.1 hypothetical protein FJ985_01840 [Mesorhizobium sp. B1-1-2]